MIGIDLVLPDFTYLRERAGRHRGHRHHPRPRGPPRRAAVGPARAGRATSRRLRRPADDGDGALQARRAQARATSTLEDAARRRARRARAVRRRAHPHDALDPRRDAPSRCTTELGTVLVTGDYKFDQTPVDGEPGRRRRAWPSSAARGCCCCAATPPTPTAPGFSPSESVVGPHLEERLRAAARGASSSPASRRTSTASSRSSTRRPRTAARSSLVGRSMRKNVNIGRSLGHIDVPEGMLVPAARGRRLPRPQARDHLDRLPGRAAVARCAAWPTATTRRSSCTTATRSSSRATPIPGNERAVNETIDRLYHIGCDVITTRDAPIHASGHGYAEEIKLMLNLDAPALRDAVPRRLQAHPPARASWPRPSASRPRTSSRARTACRWRSTSAARASASASASGMIFVDGVDIGDVADVALRDRRMLSAPTASSSSWRRSPSRTARRSPTPEVIFRGVPVPRGAPSSCSTRSATRSRSRWTRAAERGDPRDRPAPADPARRPRGVRLRAPAAPADGAARRRRGLSEAGVRAVSDRADATAAAETIDLSSTRAIMLLRPSPRGDATAADDGSPLRAPPYKAACLLLPRAPSPHPRSATSRCCGNARHGGPARLRANAVARPRAVARAAGRAASASCSRLTTHDLWQAQAGGPAPTPRAAAAGRRRSARRCKLDVVDRRASALGPRWFRDPAARRRRPAGYEMARDLAARCGCASCGGRSRALG